MDSEPEIDNIIAPGSFAPGMNAPKPSCFSAFFFSSKSALSSNGDSQDAPTSRDDDDVPEPFRKTLIRTTRQVGSFVSKNTTRASLKRFVVNRLPIIKWLPTYQLSWLFNDFIAGFTVGLTAIPQGIAYAVVAGLSPEYGLYASFTGAYIYIFLGSCKDVIIGPTAILALMTQPYVMDYSADFAILLTFLSGCVIFLFSLLQLGSLVHFISKPVVAGFSSAAAIQIASSQLKGLFGLSGKANEFLPALENFFVQITEVKLGDSLLSLFTIIILVILKVQKDYFDREGYKLWIRKLSWFGSISRNALVVILGTIIAYIFYLYGYQPFILTGEVKSGFPSVGPPPFSTVTKDGTFLNFIDMIQIYKVSLISVPFLSVLESIAISKALAKGKPVDAGQELFALGLSNIIGSFFQSMPITGSFTRTVINNASGVKTTLSCFIKGSIIILALEVLTGTFYFIPKASLSSLVVCAMYFMIEFEIVPQLWRTCKLDLIPLIVTFFGGLFWSLEYGMILGIGINLIMVLWQVAVPGISITSETILGYRVVEATPHQMISYPAAERIWRRLLKEANKEEKENFPIIVVLDGRLLDRIDTTVAQNISQLNKSLKSTNKRLILWNWQRSSRFSCVGYDTELKGLFKKSLSIEDLINDMIQKQELEPPI